MSDRSFPPAVLAAAWTGSVARVRQALAAAGIDPSTVNASWTLGRHCSPGRPLELTWIDPVVNDD